MFCWFGVVCFFFCCSVNTSTMPCSTMVFVQHHPRLHRVLAGEHPGVSEGTKPSKMGPMHTEDGVRPLDSHMELVLSHIPA